MVQSRDPAASSTRKKALTWDAQVQLLKDRQLTIANDDETQAFLRSENYYRLSGYTRYFQKAPHFGDNNYIVGSEFDVIREIYEADEQLRLAVAAQLTRAELLLRSHFAYVVAHQYGPYEKFLEEGFYLDIGDDPPTVESCLRDLKRSRERHILRFRADDATGEPIYAELPVWSAVDAWSFGTLSRCIERGDQGAIADKIAESIGVVQKGFASRVRALVYLRNRCAHHSRLWNHSVIDAGPTPNNVRSRAKKVAGGQFEPRSVLDVIASLDDIVVKGMRNGQPVLPQLAQRYRSNTEFWMGLTHPKSHRDSV